MFPSIPVKADVATTKTYDYDDYSIKYDIVEKWEDSYKAEITISNIGEEKINSWALKIDSDIDITNIWNATVYESNDVILL